MYNPYFNVKNMSVTLFLNSSLCSYVEYQSYLLLVNITTC